MSRHLIVIEGTDGSGKSTQAQLTYEAIVAAGAEVKRLTFPRYKDDSSMLVRMYLRGDFGTHPEDVIPMRLPHFMLQTGTHRLKPTGRPTGNRER